VKDPGLLRGERVPLLRVSRFSVQQNDETFTEKRFDVSDATKQMHARGICSR
jgi:hypothetical protein